MSVTCIRCRRDTAECVCSGGQQLTPTHEQIRLMDSGKLNAIGWNAKTDYVQSATLNGEPISRELASALLAYAKRRLQVQWPKGSS